MSSGEVLRTAVRQRLTAALEDVLGLVKSTVQSYEEQLSRARDETDRLRRLLHHSEFDPSSEIIDGLIKEEPEEVWSIQEQTQIQLRESHPTSGPKNTSMGHQNDDQHLQQHPSPPSTKSEDSDEECPICKHLDQRPSPGPSQHLDQRPSPGPSPGPNQHLDHRPSPGPNHHLDHRPSPGPSQHLDHRPSPGPNQHLDQRPSPGPSPGPNQHLDLRPSPGPSPGPNQHLDQRPSPGPSPGPSQHLDESPRLNQNSNHVDQETTKKTSEFENADVETENDDGGCAEDEGVTKTAAILEQAGVTGETSGRDLKRPATVQEQATVSKFRKRNNEPPGKREETAESENTGQTFENAVIHENAQSLNQLGESETSQNQPTVEGEETTRDLERSSEMQDRVSWQEIVKQRPTVKLVPLKLSESTIETNAKERKDDTDDSEDEAMDTDKRSVAQSKLSSTEQNSNNIVVRKKPQFEKKNLPSVSPKKDQRINSKEMREGGFGGKDAPVRRQLNRKAKANAKKQKDVESDSSSDTDKCNDSDYKTDKSSDSENTDDNQPRSVQKSFKNKSSRQSNVSGRGAQHLNQSQNGGKMLADDESQQTSEQPTSSSEPGSSQKITSRDGTGENHKCAECGASFTLKKNLLMHLLVHNEERPFSCSRCDATFKRKLNLKVHMSTHSREKDFECSVCAKKFTRKSNLDDHLKTHSGEKPYSCSVCSRAFSCRSNLRRHAVSHTGLRPFDCDVCGKRFGRKSILMEHMTAHTGEQAFSCSLCHAKFSRKHNLVKHLVIHRGERRFQCSQCHARFSQKAHLKQHMVGHSGEKPYSCSVCKKGFTRKAYVQQHLNMYCLGPAASDRTDDAEEKS